jgi:uncharacterized protein DUF4235
MIKVLCKPAGILVSVLAGVLAGAVLARVRKLAAHEDDAPEAASAPRSWREIMATAALQDAIFALVKAAADRDAAEGTRKLPGIWPGEGDQRPEKEA